MADGVGVDAIEPRSPSGLPHETAATVIACSEGPLPVHDLDLELVLRYRWAMPDQTMTGPPIVFLRNVGHNRVDPLRYTCRLGELAELLLIHDSVSLLTDSFLELFTLVTWFGNERLLTLLREHVCFVSA